MPANPIPVVCKPIQDEIDQAKAEIASLQNELKTASGPEKWMILQEIGGLLRKIQRLSKELVKCILQNGGALPPKPFQCYLQGVYRLVTNFPQAPGPFSGSLNIGLLFDELRQSVYITSFPQIVTEPYTVNTPLGSKKNNTSVSMIGGGFGKFDKQTGHIEIPISLYFDQSVDFPFFGEDSKIHIPFTTGNVKSPIANITGESLKPNGRVHLVGTGKFKEGVLDDYDCNIELIGEISPKLIL
ncbi:MAG: hypothetical protein IT258_15155 [Saprospiraceae bacterium]|nr:hypothetical protein [Saprospiraceae bacterium]